MKQNLKMFVELIVSATQKIYPNKEISSTIQIDEYNTVQFRISAFSYISYLSATYPEFGKESEFRIHLSVNTCVFGEDSRKNFEQILTDVSDKDGFTISISEEGFIDLIYKNIPTPSEPIAKAIVYYITIANALACTIDMVGIYG